MWHRQSPETLQGLQAASRRQCRGEASRVRFLVSRGVRQSTLSGPAQPLDGTSVGPTHKLQSVNHPSCFHSAIGRLCSVSHPQAANCQ